ncbi:hypothetical protein GCM10027270_13950 [Nocardioides ginkgobilobae]
MGIRDRFSSAREGGTSDVEPAAEPAVEPVVGEPAAAAAPTAATAGAPATAGTPAKTPRPPKAAKPAKPAKPAKAEKPAKAPRERADLTVWRTRVSQLLWTVFVLLALVLAVAALLVAIDANEDNGLVDFVLRAADAVDLGVFSRENGVREFTGDNAETKNALFNWGLGAVVYLLLGRLVERLVRPGR